MQFDFAREYRGRIFDFEFDAQHWANFLFVFFRIVDDIGERAAHAALGQLHLHTPGIDAVAQRFEIDR